MLCASPTFPARATLIAIQHFRFLLLRRLHKIAKTTVGSVRSVSLSVSLSVRPFISPCLSVLMEQLDSHWTDFDDI